MEKILFTILAKELAGEIIINFISNFNETHEHRVRSHTLTLHTKIEQYAK